METACLTERYALPDGAVTLLGAVKTVTGAMTAVEIGGESILVDCGVAQGDEAAEFRFPAEALHARAVILTHGHNDHVGSLPTLLERGYVGRIFGTRATLDIADLVLTDGLRLSGAPDDEIAAFRRCFRERAVVAPYDRPFAVDGLPGTVTFREAGHILGSASVEIRTPRSRVICSGDLGRPDSPILRDYCTEWSSDQDVDLVVMESTYGDSEHRCGHDDVRASLQRIVKSAVAAGGHVLIPAFAIGRTQTLLYHLNALIEAKQVPDVPVAVDTPLGLAVTELYDRSRGLYDREALARIARGDDPLDFEGLYAVRKRSHSERLADVTEPMIIIAGSGMCTGGRIVGHLRSLLPLEKTHVVFVGFQARGTPGRAIIEAAGRRASVELEGERVPVRARVETLGGLSAHADRVELARWLRSIPRVRQVGLHHGEPGAQRSFVEWFRAGGGA